MVDIYVIGTSGMQPLVNRRLTSAMIRSGGYITLIDAGEGTQLGIKESSWPAKSIGSILITHLHTDHVLGLAGVLLLINNSFRTEPLTIAGPKGLRMYLESLDVIIPELKFPIYFMEFEDDEEEFFSGDLEVTAFKLEHSVLCYGFSFYYRRNGVFDVKKAEKIPIDYWSELTCGRAIEDENIGIIHPNEIAGPEQLGIKVTYVTDTRPISSIVKYAAYSKLFVCESMYAGNDEKDDENKLKNYHMTFAEAATLAKEAKVDRLLLTHFSPSIPYPKNFLGNARDIFKNTSVARDGMCITLDFQSQLLQDKIDDLAIAIENPFANYISFGDRNKKSIIEYTKKHNKINVEKYKRYGKRKIWG